MNGILLVLCFLYLLIGVPFIFWVDSRVFYALNKVVIREHPIQGLLIWLVWPFVCLYWWHRLSKPFFFTDNNN